MKTLLTFILGAALLLSACKNDASPKTGEELQKIKAELEAKKKELADKQEIAEIEKELKAVEGQIKNVEKDLPASALESLAPQTANTDSGTGPKGTITGSGVTMRKEASVQSDKVDAFNQNEKVEVLESKNVNNENEAILVKPISLYEDQSGSGTEALKLQKGKAVVIETYHPENNKYSVAYMDAKKGKLYAQIDADAVETITYSTWYRVKRANGQMGWVLGKFLKTN